MVRRPPRSAIADAPVDLMPRDWPDPRDTDPQPRWKLWLVVATMSAAMLLNLWSALRSAFG